MPVLIDYPGRTVHASIRDLAALATFHRGGGHAHGLAGRARIGTEWHRQVQEESAADPTIRCEVPCRGRLTLGGWDFHLEGRIDQLLPDREGFRLREIKTISRFPSPDSDLRHSHPGWFHQASLYALLAEQTDRAGLRASILSAEILLIDLRTGLRMPLPLGPEDSKNTRTFLDHLVRIFESKRPAFISEATSEDPPENTLRPFRPAQEIAFRDLENALRSRRLAAFEAPTGFGKTAVFVRWALRQLENPSINRVIFLTGKRSGRLQIVDELQRGIGPEAGDRVEILRSRDECRPGCPFAACRTTSCDPAAPAVEIHHLLPSGNEDTPTPLNQPCPYQLGRASLPFAPIWIADLNYLFADSSSHIFLETPGYDPSSTILVIDEAHNLPDRAAAAWSINLSAAELGNLGEALLLAGSPRAIIDLISEIVQRLRPLPPNHELNLGDIYWFEDSFQILLDRLGESPPPNDLNDASITTLAKIRTARERLSNDRIPSLRHTGQGGRLQIDCTNPAPIIGPILQSFQRVCLTSATLSPFDAFFRLIGHDQTENAAVPAPLIWNHDQLDLAIDLRIDTRSTQRDRYLGLTAGTVSDFARIPADGPTLVFCPSFRYLQSLELYLREIAADLLIEAQDREDADPVQTLTNALPLGDVFLLVLGSRLSEGIDTLGGDCGKAIVISPGVPEVSAVRRRAREDADASGQDGFHEHFTLPGMRKVIQAVGRLIRSESHRARVLLHCRRFDQPATRAAFPDWWPDPTRIRNHQDWHNWLTQR